MILLKLIETEFTWIIYITDCLLLKHSWKEKSSCGIKRNKPKKKKRNKPALKRY